MSLVDLEIEKLVYGGEGLARHAGRAGFIPYTLPGERLTAEIVAERGKTFRARPVAWQQQSELRTVAPCPVFGDCGGCQYQHIPYEQQLEFKEAILRETLARLGSVEWDGPIQRIAGEPWRYRNRTQLRVHKRGRHAEVGFLAAGSHRFVAAPDCPINSPKLNEIHVALREMARERRFPAFLHEVEFFTNETDVQMNVVGTEQPLAKSFFGWAAERLPGLLPGEYIDYPSGDDVFRVGSRSFFQVNRYLTAALADAATAGASGGRALDLYAGVGLFSLPLARQFDETIGVDSSGAACRSLQFNAERAGVPVRVVHLNVDRFLADSREPVDFVLADPPRAGLGKAVTEELLRLAAPEVRIVSCDPATLARDLRRLLDGGYQLASLTLVDLFPQTFHLETVVGLRR